MRKVLLTLPLLSGGLFIVSLLLRAHKHKHTLYYTHSYISVLQCSAELALQGCIGCFQFTAKHNRYVRKQKTNKHTNAEMH